MADELKPCPPNCPYCAAMDKGHLVDALRAETAALKAALSDTRQGLWRVYEELGFDTDGEPTPASVVNLVQMVVSAAKEFRAEAEGHNALADSTVGGLMEEIAALKAELIDTQKALHETGAELKKYAGPLTDEQARWLAGLGWRKIGLLSALSPQGWAQADAAIRAVREGGTR